MVRHKFTGLRKGNRMPRSARIALLALAIGFAGPAAAQTNQLRGLPESGSSLLPSAQQQLNGNLDRQESDFRFQQRLDSNNRLNRTEQINRENNRQNTETDPCPGANEACRNED